MVCANVNGQPAGRRASFFRRATLAASCAATFWDYQTTAEGAGYGAKEGNRTFADANGRPRLKLLLTVKAGVCGLSALAQETHWFGRKRDRLMDPVWTGINTGLAERFAAAAVHNLDVIRSIQQQQAVTAAGSGAPAGALFGRSRAPAPRWIIGRPGGQ